jgi:hypothetical protein
VSTKNGSPRNVETDDWNNQATEHYQQNKANSGIGACNQKGNSNGTSAFLTEPDPLDRIEPQQCADNNGEGDRELCHAQSPQSGENHG